MANVNTLPSVSSLSNMDVLNNEILASYNIYNKSAPVDPYYHIAYMKRVQQNYHYLWYYHNRGKWNYIIDKGDIYGDWWTFRKAFKRKPPTNEKIVDIIKHHSGSDQIWAFQHNEI